jgi:DNA polymerase-3 subunit epsilon
VRSYFSGDDRRKIGRLLREVTRIDHVVCSGELEASVLEVRMIHELRPRYNRQSKLWPKYAYLKLTLDERFPRLSVVRVPKPGDGCLYLGPLSSTGAARAVAEAIEEAVPIRRCTAKPGRTPRPAPCLPAQLNVAACPCAGAIDEQRYAEVVAQVVRGLTEDPDVLLTPLARKMRALAEAHRYEEAADVRNRAAALSRALMRQRRLDGLRDAGRLALEVDGGRALVEHGRLVWAGEGDPAPTLLAADDPPVGPLPKHLADEVSCVAAFLEQRAGRVRLVSCDGTLAWPLPRLPSFEPVG